MRNFFAGFAACAVAVCAGYALASRNSAGTMAAANGPYVSGSTITSSAFNSRFADIETEITDSLDRSGKGGMLAAVRGIDGTVAAPAYSYTSETGTGQYRIGASDVGWALAGTKKLELTASLFTIVPDATLLNTTVKWRLDGTTMGGGLAGIWAGAGAASPTSSNYVFAADGAGNTSLNSATTLNLNANGANVTVTSTGLTLSAGKTVVAPGGVTIGSGGTALVAVTTGTCLTSGGTPSNCNITIVSGQVCVCTAQNSVNACSYSSGGGTTGTLTVPNGITATVTGFCFK